MKTTRTLVPGMLFQLGLRRPRPQSIMRNTSVLSWRLLWASSFFIGQAVLPELRVGLWGVGVPKLETHIYSLGSRPCVFSSASRCTLGLSHPIWWCHRFKLKLPPRSRWSAPLPCETLQVLILFQKAAWQNQPKGILKARLLLLSSSLSCQRPCGE